MGAPPFMRVSLFRYIQLGVDLATRAVVACRVLSKDTGQPIADIAAELKSEKYFALGTETR